MKIYLSEIANKPLERQETLQFDLSNSNLEYLKTLSPILIDITIKKLGEQLINLELFIKGKAVLLSSIKLDELDYDIDLKEEMLFSQDQQLEDENIIYLKDNYIETDSIIYSLIISSLPFNLKGKDEKANISGDGYRIISEEQYQKEHQKKPNAFEKLKDLDL